jgi:hypothetical protein
MANFKVQFDLKGEVVVSAESFEKAEKLAKKKLSQYQLSMQTHFQKDLQLSIDDVEEVS